MRVACVLVTHLRAKSEMCRHPNLKDSPVLIVDRDVSRARSLVVDRFPGASGVTAGMTLEQAMSRHADAVVVDADEPHYRHVFGRMLTALQGISGRVEDAGLGTAYVRLDGLEGLYRGEAGVISALLNAVPGHLRPRVGVADARFPAFVATRTRAAHGAFRVPEDAAAFLAPYAIDLLPVSAEIRTELHRFGLHTMGAVASMSAPALSDRFGREGRRAWELCNGIDVARVVPMAFEESVVERASLPFHSSSIEALSVAVDTLLKRAYSRQDMRNRYAGGTTLLCTASGWPNWERTVRFREPVGEWVRASEIVRSRLETDPPRNPIEDVTLTLTGLTGESGTQMELLKDARSDGLRRLVEADRRLRPLIGGGHALYRVVQVAPWHPAPEMRAFLAPIDPSGSDALRPVHTPRLVDVREDAEGEPTSLRMDRRWMGVDRIDDRWTFDLWWLPVPVTRSYCRIDPGDGRRITLFHDRRADRWYRQSG